jgi:SAM-dependent methyltransferase
MSLAATWPAEVGDGCWQTFGDMLRAYDPSIVSDARVLEIGCAEANGLALMAEAWPPMTLTGIDWRRCRWEPPPRGTILQADVLTVDLPAASFDWVVSVSALEHIGLGHYDADPLAEDGDTRALQRAVTWLRPGGWLYVDVPFNAGAYQVVGTSHRIYDQAAVERRLLAVHDWQTVWCRVTGPSAPVPLAQARVRKGQEFDICGIWVQR